MTHEQINLLLEEYIDDTLDVDTVLEVESHLSGCNECSEYLYSLRVLKEKIKTLPTKIEPAIDLWPDVFREIRDVKKAAAVTKPVVVRDVGTSKYKGNKKALREREKSEKKISAKLSGGKTIKKRMAVLIVLLLLILTTAVIYFYISSIENNWEITAISGIPYIDNERILTTSNFNEGNVLNTGTASETEIVIPNAGRVTAYQNSDIKRLPSINAIELLRGKIHASFSLAAKNFRIQIPGAEIAEFGNGSIFEITTDSGYSLVKCISSTLKIRGEGKEIFLPTDYLCPVWESRGLGIPYFVNAAQPLINAMETFTSGGGTTAEINTIESTVTEYDVISLWHLFQIVPEEFRIDIFNLIDKFVPPPTGSNQEGLLALNKNMLMLWLNDIQKKY
ncbi:MAG: zf-HC2 domain-containing protein [Ignavibacteriaceae bacterium]|nr:zf-HC2 domain-containing protein [Ignavibacteriaceae bacterium]